LIETNLDPGSKSMAKDEIKVLTPIGMLGYGIPENFLRMGAEMAPDVIGLDGQRAAKARPWSHDM
jgi:hypothetical protein